MKTMAKSKKKILPKSFKPLLWSYNFSKVDPDKNRGIIILNAINYGDFYHWRWLVQYYGKNGVAKELSHIGATALRPQARKLASLIFNIKEFNYAPRGAGQKR